MLRILSLLMLLNLSFSAWATDVQDCQLPATDDPAVADSYRQVMEIANGLAMDIRQNGAQQLNQVTREFGSALETAIAKKAAEQGQYSEDIITELNLDELISTTRTEISNEQVDKIAEEARCQVINGAKILASTLQNSVGKGGYAALININLLGVDLNWLSPLGLYNVRPGVGGELSFGYSLAIKILENETATWESKSTFFIGAGLPLSLGKGKMINWSMLLPAAGTRIFLPQGSLLENTADFYGKYGVADLSTMDVGFFNLRAQVGKKDILPLFNDGDENPDILMFNAGPKVGQQQAEGILAARAYYIGDLGSTLKFVLDLVNEE